MTRIFCTSQSTATHIKGRTVWRNTYLGYCFPESPNENRKSHSRRDSCCCLSLSFWRNLPLSALFSAWRKGRGCRLRKQMQRTIITCSATSFHVSRRSASGIMILLPFRKSLVRVSRLWHSHKVNVRPWEISGQRAWRNRRFRLQGPFLEKANIVPRKGYAFPRRVRIRNSRNISSWSA